MRNYFRPVQGGLAASDDLLDTFADGQESDAELADDRRARDDRDLSPLIGVIVAVGLSLPFWWMLMGVAMTANSAFRPHGPRESSGVL